MEYLDKYIPREYLALKINYCRKRLAELPETHLAKHTVRGIQTVKVKSGAHRFNLSSATGKALYDAAIERVELERDLAVYEAIWDRYYVLPPQQFVPPKIVRTLRTGSGGNVVMDKQFFDSLKNDANTKYPKPDLYSFNGISYRSAAEREIAMFYTDFGIPFKYEPEVLLAGMNRPQYPDFVFYVKELDTCKIHEHYGLMSLSSYIRDLKIKCGTYTDAGLLLDQDVFFTYSTEDQPLDIRYIAAKLNAVIYGTLISGSGDNPV